MPPPSQIVALFNALLSFYSSRLNVYSYQDDARIVYPDPGKIRAALNAPESCAWVDRIAAYITPDSKTDISTILALRSKQ